MTVINDRKTPVPLSAPFEDVAEYFLPTILMETDYFPFGMQLFDPATLTLDEDYRFGFNSHELDNEVKGTGNHYSFGDFGYDPRLGRRWQIDPVFAKYPFQSHYSAFNNNPIYFLDPDGRDAIISIKPGANGQNGTVTVLLVFNAEPGSMSNTIKQKVVAGFQKTWGGGVARHAGNDIYQGRTFTNIEIDGQKYDVTYQMVLREVESPHAARREGENVLKILPEERNVTSNYGGGILSYKASQDGAEGGTTFGHEVAHALGLGHNNLLFDESGNASITSGWRRDRQVITQDIIFSLEAAIKLSHENQGNDSLIFLETERGLTGVNTLNLKDKNHYTINSSQYETIENRK